MKWLVLMLLVLRLPRLTWGMVVDSDWTKRLAGLIVFGSYAAAVAWLLGWSGWFW